MSLVSLSEDDDIWAIDRLTQRLGSSAGRQLVRIVVRCRFRLGRVSWIGTMPVGDGVRAYLTVFAGSGSMRSMKGPVGVSGVENQRT